MSRSNLCIYCILILLMILLPACNDDDFSNASEQPDDDSEDDDTDDDTVTEPTLSDPEIIVPSSGLPEEAEVQNANNNLDVVLHEGRIFLAWRTGPTHFASLKTRLYLVSSDDGMIWDFEAKFGQDSDLREPRFLPYNGDLFLYFAVLGTNPLDFNPQGMMFSQYLGPGNWSEPQWFYEEGFIPWRTKVIDGVPYMIAYEGGESIYDPTGQGDIKVHWLTTENGMDWEPFIPGQPIVLTGGSSETDFAFLEDGTLIAVSRNEAGDELGFGSKICRAEADSLGDWQCVGDPKKYDSPLLFRHEDDIYLIGRRNLTETGNFDLGMDDLPYLLQYLLYEADYWFRPKRCSLWKVDPDNLTVDFILDLPSNGDTCFPGIVPGQAENEYIVYNYSSLWDVPDKFWLQGQLGPTVIYRVMLTVP